jgi:hypothetical protein
MSKILAINQNYLCDPRLDPVLNGINSLDRRMLAYFCKLSHENGSIQLGLMARAGQNILPFNNQILPVIDSVMPVYNKFFDLTWDQVTDMRAKEIEQRMIVQNKKLVIFWSGGIDSTCIVVALLKNFSADMLTRVIVACTAEGVVENPEFYQQHILPNFCVIDTNQYVTQSLVNDQDVLIVDGFAADTLNMSMTPSLDVCMSVRNSHMLAYDWRRDPDPLIEYLRQVTGSKEFATWYYERNRISVESVQIPIETYFDFMWWFGFNCEYYSWALHAWFFCYQHLNISYGDFQNKSVGWYRNDNYQLWAMKNTGAWVKHGHNLGSLKHYPKSYIYEYDRNEYYYKYKTKINSSGRNYNNLNQQPFAITDQFEVLSLENNLNRIIELLPSHLGSEAGQTNCS